MLFRTLLPVLLALLALSPSATAQNTVKKQKRLSIKKEKKKVKRSKAMRPKTARKHLAEKGIQPENYDKALIEYLEKGDCKTAAALIHAGAAINASGDEKKPLLLAAEHCTPEIIQMLLDKGADRECVDIQPRPRCMSMGKTAIFMAAKANNLENLKYLHKMGFSCTARTKDFMQSHTVLAEAARHGSLECVRYIIEQGGGNPHETFPGGANLMHRAAYSGNVELIKYLDSLGVDMNRLATGYGLTPLCFAGQKGHQEAMQYMLSRGANPNTDLGRNGMRTLFVLAYTANTQTMQMLMKNGANFSLKNNEGKGFRDFAKMENNQEALDFLDKHGL